MRHFDFDVTVSIDDVDLEASLDIEDVIDIFGADRIAENLSSSALLQALNDQGHICMIFTEPERDFLQRMILLLSAVARPREELNTLMEKLKCEL